MSYILDALKKAEAERQLGSVPSVHAQPAFATADAAYARRWRMPLVAASAVLVVAAILSFAVFNPWAGKEDPAVALPAAAPVPAPAPPQQLAAAPAAEAPVAPASPQAAIAPEREAVTRTQSADKAPAAKATPKPSAKEERAVTAKTKKPTANKDGENASTTQKQTTPAEQKAEVPILARHELPPVIQGEIPSFSVNGYIYSPNQTDRTVLINRKLVREGDQIAPGLMLEKLTPSGMVLNYKGYRYRSSY